MRQKRKLIQQRKLQTTNLTNDRKVKMNINKQKVLHFVLTLATGGRKILQNFLRSTWKTEYEKSDNILMIYWW